MIPDKDLPEITDKSEDEISAIIAEIEHSDLPDQTKSFAIKCIDLSVWFPIALEQKDISLSRLRTLLFGKGYGNKEKKQPNNDGAPGSDDDTKNDCKNNGDEKDGDELELPEPEPASLPETGAENQPNQDENSDRKGHGRMSNQAYKNAEDIDILLNGIAAGDPCPLDCGGKLRRYRPGIFIRVKGQAMARVIRYHQEKLRCALCGYLVMAMLTPEVGAQKYDDTFIALLALQKYYAAMPFYRQESIQALLDFPLPDSTQWDLIERLAGYCYPVFNQMKKLAANGHLIHNDDTTLRILSVINEINKAGYNGRKGMYTTGIVSDIEDNHRITLFLNGTKHSGENMSELLALRDEDKPPVIQMCDALSHNIPKKFKTILCNCMSHGVRKFKEIKDYFPSECHKIMTLLSAVYKIDAETKDMTPQARLNFHQEHSSPLMEELHAYLTTQLNDKLVEPNSELGKAIKYMLNHWHKLTRFLSVAGAPLCNNTVERALKIAIRNRKSALFYKTPYSAEIGGMITSIIYTCKLAKENPLDYLVQLQRHPQEVIQDPIHWMPWNYQQTIEQLSVVVTLQANDANLQERAPPLDCLAVT